jgi:carbon-monoxide dehydrogenase medium subunit
MTTTASGWVSKTHRAIPPFELVRPRTIEEAVAARVPGGKFIAGGIDLIQQLIEHAPESVGRLITLNSIPSLADIAEEPDAVKIGACVTHHRIESDPVLARALPDLVAAWKTIGNIRVRMAGTIGGNVMAAHPNYDGPVLLAASDAIYRFTNANGESQVRIAEEHDWRPSADALLTEIRIPRAANRRLVFERSLKPAISVAVALDRDDTQELKGRIAIGCAFSRPICRRITFRGVDDIQPIALKYALLLPMPKHDAFGLSDYRRYMAELTIRRILTRLLVS